MPELPESDQGISKKRHRREVAARRCRRALRLIVAYFAFYALFWYFGYTLYSNLSPDGRTWVPFWLFFGATAIVLYALYLVPRYVWFAPLWSLLPLLTAAAAITVYFVSSADTIDRNIYFRFFRSEREEVVRMVKAGELGLVDERGDGRVLLPDEYRHTALGQGYIVFSKGDGKLCVQFSLGLGLIALHHLFEYRSDDDPYDISIRGKDVYVERLDTNWFYVIY